MTTDPWTLELETRLAHEQPWLQNLARGLVRDEGRADDLVQETWARALIAKPRDLGGELEVLGLSGVGRGHRPDQREEAHD